MSGIRVLKEEQIGHQSAKKYSKAVTRVLNEEETTD